MTDRYQSLFIAALIVLAAGILLALIRAIRGPRVADRIMGINMIGTMSTACIAILSVLLRQSWLLDVGLICVLLGLLGVYRFRFVLNRMHCASLIDTMGIFFILLSLVLATRSLGYLPKLLLLLLFLWIGSPIASHLVSRMEVSTDETASEHMKEEDRA